MPLPLPERLDREHLPCVRRALRLQRHVRTMHRTALEDSSDQGKLMEPVPVSDREYITRRPWMRNALSVRFERLDEFHREAHANEEWEEEHPTASRRWGDPQTVTRWLRCTPLMSLVRL